jgi:hypothetical protein
MKISAKRTIAIILTALLLLSITPFKALPVFAAGEDISATLAAAAIPGPGWALAAGIVVSVGAGVLISYGSDALKKKVIG